MSVKSLVGSILPPSAKARIFTFQAICDFARTGGTVAKRECNVCGYKGQFYPFGLHLRRDAGCPNCRSFERHRLFKLFFDANRQHFDGKDILHFAPEKSLSQFVGLAAKSYTTADLFNENADLRLDIEQIVMPNAFDTIIASHVLEHVDDYKALRSIHDTLRPGGVLLAMVPIYEGTTTFEDNTITDKKERELYFGQHDHLRCYGSDFVDRVESANFRVRRFYAEEKSIPRYNLMRGDCVFCCRRT